MPTLIKLFKNWADPRFSFLSGPSIWPSDLFIFEWTPHFFIFERTLASKFSKLSEHPKLFIFEWTPEKKIFERTLEKKISDLEKILKIWADPRIEFAHYIGDPPCSKIMPIIVDHDFAHFPRELAQKLEKRWWHCRVSDSTLWGCGIVGSNRALSIAIDASRRGESDKLGENEVVGDRSELRVI